MGTNFRLTFTLVKSYHGVRVWKERSREKMEKLGKIIRRRRSVLSLTLHGLATKSGVSASHLARIESEERFPSARVLKRIAGPLRFEENELFTLAGYLSSPRQGIAEEDPSYKGLDPYVAKMLAQETVEVQRAVIKVLALLKSIDGDRRPLSVLHNMAEGNSRDKVESLGPAT